MFCCNQCDSRHQCNDQACLHYVFCSVSTNGICLGHYATAPLLLYQLVFLVAAALLEWNHIMFIVSVLHVGGKPCLDFYPCMLYKVDTMSPPPPFSRTPLVQSIPNEPLTPLAKDPQSCVDGLMFRTLDVPHPLV